MTPPRTTQRPSAMTDQDVQATTNLLESLYSFGKNPGDDAKLLRHTDHTVAMPSTSTSTSTYDDGTSAKTTTAASDDPPPSLTITSWKMQDYAYKRDPCPYPTRARGLFTLGKHRMVARAYDKFFNVDEVTWTKASCDLTYSLCIAGVCTHCARSGDTVHVTGALTSVLVPHLLASYLTQSVD